MLVWLLIVIANRWGSPCQRRAARRLPESAFRAVAVSVGFGGEVYLFVR
jgi:hypothetical protein